MAGFVYRWTNNVNGKKYIGSHNGSKANYIGSGLLFVRAIEKYGIENFSREILYEGPLFREKEEEFLKSVDAANSSDYYNLKNEAVGGSFVGEKNGMWKRLLPSEVRYKQGSAFRGKKRPDHSQKMLGELNPMFGKNEHTHGLKKWTSSIKGKTFEEIHGPNKSKIFREKMSKARKGSTHIVKQVTCTTCGITGSASNMTRYHFDNCNAVFCVGCRKVSAVSVLASHHSNCFLLKWNPDISTKLNSRGKPYKRFSQSIAMSGKKLKRP